MTRQDNARKRVTRILILGCALLTLPAYAHAAKPAAPSSNAKAEAAAARTAMLEHKGIWKWVVPPVKMNGAFDDHDPIGLVAGKLIAADCAFNLTDPDTHKLYCFTSATSLVYFLSSPQTYLAKAEKHWQRLKGTLHHPH